MAQNEDGGDDGHPPPNSQPQDDTSSGKGKADAKKKNPLVRIIIMVLLVLVVVGWGAYWFLTRNNIETDDAYTEGRKLSVAPHVDGYVTKLLVNDNQYVQAGQLLVKIDDRDYLAALHRAEAQVEQAQANLAGSRVRVQVAQDNFPGRLIAAQGSLAAAKAQLYKAETDYRRQQTVSRQATTQQNIDYAKAALDQARAQVLQAEGELQQAKPVIPNVENTKIAINQEDAALKAADAAVVQAQLNYGWPEIRAPHDGWISQRNVEQGNFVQAGQKLFSIVEPEVWVVANYKETQLAHMRPGQKVDIEVDAYPSLELHGHVDSVQLGAGAAFSTFPPENATGNFVKIVQRVPVKIIIDSGLDPKIPLPLGISVVPTVYVQ